MPTRHVPVWGADDPGMRSDETEPAHCGAPTLPEAAHDPTLELEPAIETPELDFFGVDAANEAAGSARRLADTRRVDELQQLLTANGLANRQVTRLYQRFWLAIHERGAAARLHRSAWPWALLGRRAGGGEAGVRAERLRAEFVSGAERRVRDHGLLRCEVARCPASAYDVAFHEPKED